MKETKYSIWSNYRFVYGNAWRTDKKIVIYLFIRAFFEVAATFMTIALPAIVVSCLEQRVEIKQMVFVFIVSFSVAGIVYAARTYFDSVGYELNTNARIDGQMLSLIEKALQIDYELLEREDIVLLKQKAFDSCWGNDWGYEKFLHANVELLKGVLGLVGYILLLNSIQPILVFILLSISLVQLSIFGKVKKYALSHRNEKASHNRTFDYFRRVAFENSAGKDIRLFSMRGWLIQIYEHHLKGMNLLVSKERLAYFAYDLCGLTLQLVRDIACYGYLFQQMRNGMDVSQFILFLGVVSGFGNWFTIIFENIGRISLDTAMISDLRRWLEYPDITTKIMESAVLNEVKALEIKFENVSYQYPGTEKYVLKDVNFRIRPGEKIALVGMNGAGKSTMVKLLSGLYTPTEGRILINGTDLSKINREEYQTVVAPVFQDAIQLAFTIGENVAAQKPEMIDWDRCNQAVLKAGLEEKVNTLPNGVNTFLDKTLDMNGVELSGGEKQKLMLARVLYKKAKLVLLDEPTAAMDSIAEAETYKLYQEELKDQTVFFISHRLASTRFCDRIMLLQNGTIAEEGTHEQLLRKQELYAEMYEVQKQYYQEKGVTT